MRRRKFLTLTSIISTSCSYLPLLKKEEIICLNQVLSKNRIGSDGLGEYYLHRLKSGKEVAFRITSNEKNKYNLEDCFRIIPNKIRDKYSYKDKDLPIYTIKGKVNQ